ncbi:MAG: sugar nucleotide-binding protein [Bryobacteraceae bacterium]|jgi:dTDP-4-dehydrorhamnose reductase
MHKVLITGGSGMLGSMAVDCLSRSRELEVTATVRDASFLATLAPIFPGVHWELFDVERAGGDRLARLVEGHEWIVNAIGITKPLINDRRWTDLERAVKINAAFPIELARAAETCGARVLQIATDCAYSGARGPYRESSAHDALDVYGKTKSLGEVPHPSVHHLRCSIIGPEPGEGRFLLSWLLGQPRQARVKGYVNHFWNGVTTLQFAQLCAGVIRNDVRLPQLQHVVPGDAVSKAELLRIMAEAYGRDDIHVDPVRVDTVVDRTLATEDSGMNADIWAAAGHQSAPTIASMVAAMAMWNYRSSLVPALCQQLAQCGDGR